MTARRTAAVMVVVGISFHAVNLMSIFDIYFKSPLVHGMAPTPAAPMNAPAERLVLIVGDGLRADRLFEACAAGRAPFLRGVAGGRGAWGISHTRVPTESRPCHVAMCAGFYEDVSAVMKGWKANPVEFDHVFNESDRAWGFGSPDIVPLFSRNAPQMAEFCYGAEKEDFGDAEGAGRLDEWVFSHAEALFAAAAQNASLSALLRQPRSVFFLHLLALDTIGHGFKPHSGEYARQITAVDAGVARIHALFESSFEPGTTAFLFTADHGMSNKGSHGDGEPENTRTPLLVWGAGVRGPRSRHAKPSLEDTPADWNLDTIDRHDVSQADLAPLMASLIGVPFPMNSVGVLPTDFLATSDEHKAWAFFHNTEQMLRMYLRKHEQKSAAMLYREFPPLSGRKIEESRAAIAGLLRQGRFEEAMARSRVLMARSLDGLSYLQKYDWPFLMCLIVASYILWMIYVVLFVTVRTGPEAAPAKGIAPEIMLVSILTALSAYLLSQRSPPMYYVYAAFPCYFAWCAASSLGQLESAFILRSPTGSIDWVSSFLNIGTAALAYLSTTALIISYFHREVISVAFLVITLLPLVFGWRFDSALSIMWAVVCLGCGIFPLLPAELVDSPLLITIGGIAVLVIGALPLGHRIQFGGAIFFRLLLLSFAVFLDVGESYHLASGIGIPTWFVQYACWAVLAMSLSPWPSVSCKTDQERIAQLFLQLSAPYVLLSVSYEPLFIAVLFALLQLWPSVTMRSRKLQEAEEFHVSGTFLFDVVLYLFLCYAAFFSTGNVASISGFEVSSTYRFVTVFSPFLMMALLALKIFIPFVIVACVFFAVCRARDLSPTNCLFMVVGLSDFASIVFFFLVRDTGSWRDIGMSIGNFSIANLFILLQLLLLVIARAVVGQTITASAAAVR